MREARHGDDVVMEQLWMRVFTRAEFDQQFVDVETAEQRVAR
jgi:hypothetical protein